MADTGPVASWEDDYDIFDADFVRDPYPIWGRMRNHCPVAHTDRWGGSYMPCTYDSVTQVAHDVENFTSFDVNVVPISIDDYDGDERIRSIIESDPPDHGPERRLMLPFFSPRSVESYRASTRDHCRRLIDGFVGTGSVDAAADYARQIPPRVIADILGIDPDLSDQFTEWVQGVLEYGHQDPATMDKYWAIIMNFFEAEIERRKIEPDDNLVSFLLSAEIDGQPLPMAVIRGNLALMLIAGIDTTWSSIGSALWHLATHAADRQRLVDEPALLPTAIEEFLRAYSPVTMARLARNDTTIGDRPVGKDQRVLLPFPAANRDPAVFEDPDTVMIDRAVNRHVAFGTGIHRCLGSNLARLEMHIAIEEFLSAIPVFELQDPTAVTWAGGQVRGPRRLPIAFPARSAP